MNERTGRARRTTAQALSSNTGALAASAWLADRGITPEDSRWSIELELAVPGAETRFQLDVYAEEWGFQFRHGGQASWIRVTDIAFVHGIDDHALLARTPRLRDIAILIRELEREHAIQFDRDAVKIRTHMPDADAALRAWVARL